MVESKLNGGKMTPIENVLWGDLGTSSSHKDIEEPAEESRYELTDL